MDRWFGTAVAVFGIVACFFVRYVFSKFGQKSEETTEHKTFAKYGFVKPMLVILFILCIILLIYVWSDVFLWTRPRILLPGPILRWHGLIS